LVARAGHGRSSTDSGYGGLGMAHGVLGFLGRG
jgi:hypothetical protein